MYFTPGLDWQTSGKCYGAADPRRWDAERVGNSAQAEQLCTGCPVRQQCRAFAEETFDNSPFLHVWEAECTELHTTGVVMDWRVW